MRVTSKGQVTIPTELRDLLGAQEGDDLLFYQDESGRVVISRAQIIIIDWWPRTTSVSRMERIGCW